MRKHRFRSRIKSIVGSLIDSDKDEELKHTNIETEDKYKKILELLNDENQQDKNKLTGLIQEFHNRYQSIYQRYDSITGKLKEKVGSKKGKKEKSSSSSSSGSDSDSDNSSKSKNGKVELIEELNRKLAVETEEKEALNLQLQAALIKVQESEETEEMFNELKLQNSILLAEKMSLISENEKAMETIEELRAIKDGFVSELKASEEEKSNLIQTLRATEAEKKSLLLKVSDLSKEIENDIETIEDLKSDLEIKVDEVNTLTETVRNLEVKNTSLSLKVSELSKEIKNDVETIEDLKSDLEIKVEEVNTLTETVRNLEVKIRLSSQKLRVTEQMLNETEHDHTTKEQKLHQQNEILTEKISNLCETIYTMKTEVQEKVNEALKGFDLLAVKFEEDYGHVMTRVCEIRNEVKAVEIQARVNRSNNECLREKVGETEAELESVRGRVLEKDEKIKELEDVICVKDEEMLCVCEGKREVIRQLCVWGDYQRDRCHHFQELVNPRVIR